MKKEKSKKIIKNEVIIKLKVGDKDRYDSDIYFLNNHDKNEEDEQFLKQLNQTNVDLFINNKKYKYSPCFKPSLKGIYTIRLVFKINLTTCKSMFANCKNITSIDLSSFDTSKVTNMSEMFYDCQNLEELDLSSLNTKNITDMSCMFYNCKNLLKLNLSFVDTKNVTNMEYMFYDVGLSSINLSSFNTSKVTNMEGMFAFSELMGINGLNFDTKNVTNMKALFKYCKSLKSINISSFDTSNVLDMSEMFRDSGIIDINLSSFNTKNVKTMDSMFWGCHSLTCLDISSFEIQNDTNVKSMFDDSFNLKEIFVNKNAYKKIKEVLQNARYRELVENPQTKLIQK